MDHEQVLMHPNELGGRKSRFKFGVGVCRMSCRLWDRSPPCIRLMSSLIQEAPGATSQSDFNQINSNGKHFHPPPLLRTWKAVLTKY